MTWKFLRRHGDHGRTNRTRTTLAAGNYGATFWDSPPHTGRPWPMGLGEPPGTSSRWLSETLNVRAAIGSPSASACHMKCLHEEDARRPSGMSKVNSGLSPG